MKDVATLIQERASRGELSILSLIASTGRPGTTQTLFKASARNPKNGDLSTGENADPVTALLIALRGDNAGINKTKKRSTARILVEPEEEPMDFG